MSCLAYVYWWLVFFLSVPLSFQVWSESEPNAFHKYYKKYLKGLVPPNSRFGPTTTRPSEVWLMRLSPGCFAFRAFAKTIACRALLSLSWLNIRMISSFVDKQNSRPLCFLCSKSFKDGLYIFLSTVMFNYLLQTNKRRMLLRTAVLPYQQDIRDAFVPLV